MDTLVLQFVIYDLKGVNVQEPIFMTDQLISRFEFASHVLACVLGILAAAIRDESRIGQKSVLPT